MILVSSATKSRSSPGKPSNQDGDLTGFRWGRPPPRPPANGQPLSSSRGLTTKTAPAAPPPAAGAVSPGPNWPKRVSPLFKNAKEISSKPTSSPAMTNRPDLHLLPRVGHKNGARCTSSAAGAVSPEQNELLRSKMSFAQKGFAPFKMRKRFRQSRPPPRR